MVYPLLQSTCYDSSVSYITQRAEFVRILPHNANGSWCQDIDLRLVVQVFPRDLRVPTPCCVIGLHSAQCLGSISRTSSEYGCFQGVSLINVSLYLVFVDTFCKIWWTPGFCSKLKSKSYPWDKIMATGWLKDWNVWYRFFLIFTSTGSFSQLHETYSKRMSCMSSAINH